MSQNLGMFDEEIKLLEDAQIGTAKMDLTDVANVVAARLEKANETVSLLQLRADQLQARLDMVEAKIGLSTVHVGSHWRHNKTGDVYAIKTLVEGREGTVALAECLENSTWFVGRIGAVVQEFTRAEVA